MKKLFSIITLILAVSSFGHSAFAQYNADGKYYMKTLEVAGPVSSLLYDPPIATVWMSGTESNFRSLSLLDTTVQTASLSKPYNDMRWVSRAKNTLQFAFSPREGKLFVFNPSTSQWTFIIRVPGMIDAALGNPTGDTLFVLKPDSLFKVVRTTGQKNLVSKITYGKYTAITEQDDEILVSVAKDVNEEIVQSYLLRLDRGGYKIDSTVSFFKEGKYITSIDSKKGLTLATIAGDGPGNDMVMEFDHYKGGSRAWVERITSLPFFPKDIVYLDNGRNFAVAYEDTAHAVTLFRYVGYPEIITKPSVINTEVGKADTLYFVIRGDTASVVDIPNSIFETKSDRLILHPSQVEEDSVVFEAWNYGRKYYKVIVPVHVSGTLPVEIVSFSLIKQTGGNLLSWNTKSETNNYGFEVECSPDAKNFKKVGFVSGNGTSTEAHSYQYFHTGGLQNGYYRLKQLDTDGKFEYSDILSISSKPETTQLFQNYPNPFNPSTQVKYILANETLVSFAVYNILGQKVFASAETKIAGEHVFRWDAKDASGNMCSSGIYFLRFSAGNTIQTISMTLLR